MIIDSQMTELGYSLKSYRVRNNITQQELADRLWRKLPIQSIYGKQKYANRQWDHC